MERPSGAPRAGAGSGNDACTPGGMNEWQSRFSLLDADLLLWGRLLLGALVIVAGALLLHAILRPIAQRLARFSPLLTSVVQRIEEVIASLKERIAILLVEQYLDFARSISDRYVVLSRGGVIESGESSAMDHERIKSFVSV